MTTYRTGNHWGVTIVREGVEPSVGNGYRRPDDQLVAVVVNGDTALAERICLLLNSEPKCLTQTTAGMCHLPLTHAGECERR